uniref:Domain of unknown function at the cortex 1 domain-containing protein n=1 Tax=Alexandrium monilatum TaxID=311494 RepID=A0A7S4UZN3_9DINO
MEAGSMAAIAAASVGAAVAACDASSAMTSFAEFGFTTAAAGTGATAAAVLAAGSVGMAASGAATAMAIVAASGMHDLGSAACSAVSEAVMGKAEKEERRTRTEEEKGGVDPYGEWVTGPGLPGASNGSRGLQQDKSRVQGWVLKAGSKVGCFSCLPCFSGMRRRSSGSQTPARPVARPIVAPVEHAVPKEPTYLPEKQHIPGSAVPPKNQEHVPQSRATIAEHVKSSLWHPTVMLYDASPNPPPKSSAQREPRTAYRFPLNCRHPCPIDNEHFQGNFLFLHRLPENCGPAGGPEGEKKPLESPYEWHFENKTRRWEARVQGKFRRKPSGTLWTGCVLEDFDYSAEYSWAAGALAAAVVPLMEAVVGERFYFAWGDRSEAAEKDDAELATIVTNLAGTDQVIHTPRNEPVPGIDSDISSLGLRRNAMAASEYRKAVQRVVDEMNSEDTYTFCVWGCSRYIDVMSSSFTTPTFGAFSYAGFIDEWPAHFVLYSLEDDDKDPRHIERKKKYFVDVMVWSSDMHMPKLPERYAFKDERKPPAQKSPQAPLRSEEAASSSGLRAQLSRRPLASEPRAAGCQSPAESQLLHAPATPLEGTSKTDVNLPQSESPSRRPSASLGTLPAEEAGVQIECR